MTNNDGQLTQADLASMTYEQINTARVEGRLQRLLTGRDPEPQAAQLTRADLEGMSYEQINTARAEGRLGDLLGHTS